MFPGAPRYTTLARSIQRDLRAFFGSHAAAMQEANALLFSVGKAETVCDGISAAVTAGLGAMRDGNTFRMHAPVLNRLPAVLRVLVGCAGVLRGGTEGADFIDIKTDGRRVGFIACTDATARLPIYTERTRVDLGRLRVTVDQPEGMILYLKGRFLPSDAPGLAEQLVRPEADRCGDRGRGGKRTALRGTPGVVAATARGQKLAERTICRLSRPWRLLLYRLKNGQRVQNSFVLAERMVEA